SHADGGDARGLCERPRRGLVPGRDRTRLRRGQSVREPRCRRGLGPRPLTANVPPERYEATGAADKPPAAPAERYRPERERAGTALCLSGGGFRATLFHLGALRRLNETGVLAKLDTITSVSGGSIMAVPVRTFASRNLRTRAMLSRLLRPWNTSGGVRGLLAGYAARLSSAKLAAL